MQDHTFGVVNEKVYVVGSYHKEVTNKMTIVNNKLFVVFFVCVSVGHEELR